MPKYSKQEFAGMIKPDGRVVYVVTFYADTPWDELTDEEKAEACGEDSVEDGYLLTDLQYHYESECFRKKVITVNADASNWKASEE
jgi:hypothetical protein